MSTPKSKASKKAAAAKPDTVTLELGTFETVTIDTIKPYWRNPRRVTEDAVNQLVASIRAYGYQQPIVVDAEYVIIVGHTRYAAMRRIGAQKVPVMVATHLTPEQVKQYRLIDNKAGEFSSWDYTSLMDELAEIDDATARAFFPEVTGGMDEVPSAEFTEAAMLDREWDRVDRDVEFVCPACFHQWEVEVTKAAILAGVIRTGAKE